MAVHPVQYRRACTEAGRRQEGKPAGGEAGPASCHAHSVTSPCKRPGMAAAYMGRRGPSSGKAPRPTPRQPTEGSGCTRGRESQVGTALLFSPQLTFIPTANKPPVLLGRTGEPYVLLLRDSAQGQQLACAMLSPHPPSRSSVLTRVLCAYCSFPSPRGALAMAAAPRSTPTQR